jgi:pimeloyl-ACP methyl ester carboxylesterase
MKYLQKGNLKYIEQGKGETILFFHGFGMSPFLYKSIIDYLSKKYHVVAPFIVSYKNFRSIEKTISELVGDKKIILIGHSAGGIAAENFATDFNGQIKALILMDALGGGSEQSSWGDIFKESFRRLTHPNKITRLMFKDILGQMPRIIKLMTEIKYILAFKAEVKINFPVLILWGNRDTLIQTINAEKLHKRLKGSKLNIIDGDHFWFLDHQKTFEKEFAKFIK